MNLSSFDFTMFFMKLKIQRKQFYENLRLCSICIRKLKVDLASSPPNVMVLEARIRLIWLEFNNRLYEKIKALALISRVYP